MVVLAGTLQTGTVRPADLPPPPRSPRPARSGVQVNPVTASQLEVTWEPPPLGEPERNIQGYKVPSRARSSSRPLWDEGRQPGPPAHAASGLATLCALLVSRRLSPQSRGHRRGAGPGSAHLPPGLGVGGGSLCSQQLPPPPRPAPPALHPPRGASTTFADGRGPWGDWALPSAPPWCHYWTLPKS